jgi:hypothetical protein
MQFARAEDGAARQIARPVPVTERPPAASLGDLAGAVPGAR